MALEHRLRHSSDGFGRVQRLREIQRGHLRPHGLPVELRRGRTFTQHGRVVADALHYGLPQCVLLFGGEIEHRTLIVFPVPVFRLGRTDTILGG